MMPEALFPFVAFGLIMAIPITAILTGHQRKMAEILHQNQTDQGNANNAMLVSEITRLRDIIAQQSIAIDNLAQSQRNLETRLGNVSVSERLNA